MHAIQDGLGFLLLSESACELAYGFRPSLTNNVTAWMHSLIVLSIGSDTCCSTQNGLLTTALV